MPTFAAVDIGSNSVRLKIAKAVRGRLEELHEEREVTRLGESVFAGGALDPQAMAHTLRVLRRFHRAAQSYGADRVRVVATSALRDARNGRAFRDWVLSATGWKVDVISGLEEGRLIHLGVLSGARVSKKRALLIDLGGGSCELTLSISGHIDDMVSLPIGAVRLTQTFLHHDPPWRIELEQMRGVIQREVSRIRRRIIAAKLQIVLATSGTPAALSGLYTAKVRGYDESKAHTVPQAAVASLLKELSRRNLSQRRALPGIGPRRAEIIVAGTMVFAELMQLCHLPSFRYLPLGLRDGLLAQMMADYNASTAMRERVESERHDALLAVAKHYGADLQFAQRIRDLALQLFQRLKRVHQLPAEYEDWLEAAAMLHEVGAYINRSGRRRHTYYVISNSELFGYTPLQRRIIAAVARYVGKSLPTPNDRVMSILPGVHQIHVAKAVSLLRLARALDQGRRSAVSHLKIRLHQDGQVRLLLTPRAGEGTELELWAVEQEKDYFETVFGRELLAEAC
ncbi:MAG: Ppx/GppA phosphatase family protein [Candidatus Korobacteraceae bacterium]|jgi:exopolyphosphatase/guanosine-5'-triphosphate,3'-diphosphate pyrophosphatase